MSPKELAQLFALMNELWGTAAGASRFDEKAKRRQLAVHYPLWVDVPFEPAVQALYELKRNGHRFQPSVAEVVEQIDPDNASRRDWDWWNRQITAAIDEYRRAAAHTPPPEFIEHDDGTVTINPNVAPWDTNVPQAVREVIGIYGGIAHVAERYHDSCFRTDLRRFVESERPTVGVGVGFGAKALEMYQSAIGARAVQRPTETLKWPCQGQLRPTVDNHRSEAT